MAMQQINFKDLSKEELEQLKDLYIDLKVKGMTSNDLKNFASENISLQIKSTIGDDEELEAWQEMENFFKDEFENIIRDLQIKMNSKNSKRDTVSFVETRIENKDIRDDKKLDMWED